MRNDIYVIPTDIYMRMLGLAALRQIHPIEFRQRAAELVEEMKSRIAEFGVIRNGAEEEEE